MCFLSQCNVNILNLYFRCYTMCVVSKHFCHSRSSKCFTQWPQIPLFTHTRDALEPDSSGFTFLCGGNASELVPCDCLYWIPLNQCLDKVVSQRGRQTWELFFNPLCQPHEVITLLSHLKKKRRKVKYCSFLRLGVIKYVLNLSIIVCFI